MCHNQQASWDMGTTQEPCGLAQLSSRPSSLCALQAPRITLGSPEMRLHFVLRISPHPGLRPYLRLSPDLQSFSFAAHFFLLLQSLMSLSPLPPSLQSVGGGAPSPPAPPLVRAAGGHHAGQHRGCPEPSGQGAAGPVLSSPGSPQTGAVTFSGKTQVPCHLIQTTCYSEYKNMKI